jgi:hypothetical protein
VSDIGPQPFSDRRKNARLGLLSARELNPRQAHAVEAASHPVGAHGQVEESALASEAATISGEAEALGCRKSENLRYIMVTGVTT